MGKKFHRFLQKNRNKGIPNLMLYLCIANTAFYLIALVTGNQGICDALDFNLGKILQGQIWRCFTWLLTYGMETYGGGMGLLYIVFYILFNKWLGDVLESVWGTFRLNLYYLGGALLTTVLAVVIGLVWRLPVIVTAYYMNISLMLAVATLMPEQRVNLFGIIPLKMRWLALLDLALILMSLLSNTALYSGVPGWQVWLVFGTAPVVSLVNYVLNFGKGVGRLLPIKSTYRQKKRQMEFRRGTQANPNWADAYRKKAEERSYRHKCTVCGRTDTTHPELEFRYCSQCKGYFCYCSDHIRQHTHIE